MYSLINTQPREPIIDKMSGEWLDVIKIFGTLQGEGPFAGRPAVFVRLAGCNFSCIQCDTDYTTDRQAFDIPTIASCVGAIAEQQGNVALVVITGGEPFRQNIGPLVNTLLGVGMEVQIETNGTLFQSLPYDLRKLNIICSPKAPAIHGRLGNVINAYKYVLDCDHVNPENGLPLDILGDTRICPAYPPTWFRKDMVFLQGKDEGPLLPRKTWENGRAAAKSCMKFGWRLGVQIHKIYYME